MASSKTCSSSLALFLILNLLFFALVSAGKPCPGPKPKPKAKPKPKPTPRSYPNPHPKPTPNPSGGSSPYGGSPTSSEGGNTTCPRNALNLGVCANVLKLVNVTLGDPPVKPCCSLLDGLVDLEAALCFCTALKANILGINLNIPLSLSVLLNVCSRQVPHGFQCP